MESPSLTDRFTFNSRDYLLRTTDDTEAKRVVARYFSEGKVSFASELSYNGSLDEHGRQQLVIDYHQKHKAELTRLFQLHFGQDLDHIGTQVRYLLAHGFLRYGMLHEAISNLEFILQNQSASPQIRIVLGKAYLKDKKYRQALDQFSQASAVHQNFADLYFYCGVCLYYSRDCVEAIKFFSRTLKINPHFGEAHFYAALTLLLNVKLAQEYSLAKRLPERALQLLAYAGEILPLLRTEAYEQGAGLITAKKYENALEVLAPLAASLEAGKASLLNYEFYLNAILGLDQMSFEQVWQEIVRLEALVQRNPHYADLCYELGFAYAVLGVSISSRSISCMNKALAINPDYEAAQRAVELFENGKRNLSAIVQDLLPLHL
ncbi:MAG: hypothetical protein ACREOO_25305 [bacterium]